MPNGVLSTPNIDLSDAQIDSHKSLRLYDKDKFAAKIAQCRDIL
jgi:hypothetical protein